MNSKKIVMIIIEYLYLATGAFCIGVGFYYQAKYGFMKSWMFFGIGLISIGMFGVRRLQRKNMEKRETRKK